MVLLKKKYDQFKAVWFNNHLVVRHIYTIGVSSGQVSKLTLANSHLFVQRRALDSDKKTCRRHQHFPKVTAKENFKNRMAKEDIKQRSVFQNKNR